MRVDNQIKAMLNHQISYEPFVRYDGRGRPEYSNILTSPCYITSEVKMVRNLEGEEVVSSLTIFLSGTDAERLGLVTTVLNGLLGTISGNAHMGRLTLPNGRHVPILGVLPYYNEKGILNYVEVHL